MSKYNIGIYLRISIKDKESIDESNSIKVQSEIIRRFISESKDLEGCTVTTYCDDGYSGTNFNRDGVKKLLDDIRDGTVNCVIVKDECVIIGLNSERPDKHRVFGLSPIFFDPKKEIKTMIELI